MYHDRPYSADHLFREGNLAYGLLLPMRPLQPLPEERGVSLHPVGNGRRCPGSHTEHLIRIQKRKQCKHWQTRQACAVRFTPPDEKQFSTL